MSALPKDSFLLLSVVNMKLRDFYSSLDALCEDLDESRADICARLSRKFTDDEEYIRRELESALSRTLCLELEIDHMTGKRVNES